MHRRYLWIDQRGADVYYSALGNIDISATGRGTLVVWTWPAENGGSGLLNDFMPWRIEIDENNHFRPYWGRGISVKSGGTEYNTTDIERNISDPRWEMIGVTWDFASGQVRLYWDGQAHGAGLEGVPAPQGTALKLYLGPAYVDVPSTALEQRDWNVHLYWLAVWDEVMTAEQMAALYAEGRRYRVRGSEGPGNLTLLATFDNGYDADVAEGDGTFYTTEGVPADRYCLIDDGVRRLGRRIFPLGMPRHDLAEDDRKPIQAILPVWLGYQLQLYDYVSAINDSEYAELKIATGFSGNASLGATMPKGPVVDGAIEEPCTYRQLIHMPKADNVAGKTSRVGPVAYTYFPPSSSGVFDYFGSGRTLKVVADAANTATSFKVQMSGDWSDGYWAGASLVFINGNCAGRRLMVSGYDATTGFITLEAALPAVPEAGSVGVVNFTPRLVAVRDNGMVMREQGLDAFLWCEHEGTPQFVELEWIYSGAGTDNGNCVYALRYDRGRCAYVAGIAAGQYGKPFGEVDPEYGAGFRLQKVEIDGPQEYQLLAKQENGAGPSLSDNFALVRGGKSIKVWRQAAVEWKKNHPVKISDWNAVAADLKEAGTWRHSVVGAPIPVLYEEETATVVALVQGKDAEGVARLGYVEGRWDEESGRIRWSDEQAPEGCSNPFIEVSALRTDIEQDAPVSAAGPVAVLQAPDGTWSLFYWAKPAAADKHQTFALHGAKDRWSFDVREHWGEDNPVVPVFGGPDLVAPDGGGINSWANMDAQWQVTRNEWATNPGMAYWGVARGKSIQNRYVFRDDVEFSVDFRPIVGVAGADPRSLAPLPHGNSISPLAGPQVHACTCAVMGREDRMVVLSDGAIGFTYGIGLYVSEDGKHFQELFIADATGASFIPQGELPGEPGRLYPARPFRLGDKQIFYYTGGDEFVNFAWQRWEGETSYELAAEAVEGWIETAIIQQPAGGWQELVLNADPAGGTVAVEVIDAATEEAIAGFGREDCDAIADDVEQMVTWGGASLRELTAQYIRLRFHLKRETTSAESPVLYAWAIAATEASKPQASNLRVEGLVNPAMVSDRTPTFSWEYSDPGQSPQSAYQILVASSKALLDSGIGDIWDSGVVLSGDTEVVYQGEELRDATTYFWKVRVRNSEGVWSESW